MIKMEQDHGQFSDRVSDSDRSLSPTDAMTASNNRNNSFCIDALLAKDNRCNSPSTTTISQNSSRSASISPGSEIQELRGGGNSFDELPISNALSARSNMLTMSSAAAILANHNESTGNHQNNGHFYGLYPVGSSAFQPLPRMDMNNRAINVGGAVTKMLGGPVGHSTMTAGHLQQMQLEWFARAGMFYAGPRLQESPGKL
jgi:hypothetical protein